jgi:hypothetical protein
MTNITSDVAPVAYEITTSIYFKNKENRDSNSIVNRIGVEISYATHATFGGLTEMLWTNESEKCINCGHSIGHHHTLASHKFDCDICHNCKEFKGKLLVQEGRMVDSSRYWEF